TVRLEARGDLGEIDAACVLAMRELHRVAAAKRRRARAEPAFEILEAALLAAGTLARFVRARDLELQHRAGPEIEAQHRRRDAVEMAREDLERLGGLEIRDDRDGRAEHADRVARRHRAGR